MLKRLFPIAVAASIAGFSLASAQTPAQPAQKVDPNAAAFEAAQANPKGPLVPGLCIVFKERVLGTSTVGVFAAGRLTAIENEVNNEVAAARNQAQTDARALEAQRATLGEQAFLAQAQALAQRYDTLYQIRSRELQATNQMVEQRIYQEMGPVVIDVFQARNCTVILDASAVIMRANALDITTDVVQRLNTRITQFPISKVVAQVAPAQGAPTAGVPATPPPAGGGRPAQGPAR